MAKAFTVSIAEDLSSEEHGFPISTLVADFFYKNGSFTEVRANNSRFLIDNNDKSFAEVAVLELGAHTVALARKTLPLVRITNIDRKYTESLILKLLAFVEKVNAKRAELFYQQCRVLHVTESSAMLHEIGSPDCYEVPFTQLGDVILKKGRMIHVLKTVLKHAPFFLRFHIKQELFSHEEQKLAVSWPFPADVYINCETAETLLISSKLGQMMRISYRDAWYLATDEIHLGHEKRKLIIHCGEEVVLCFHGENACTCEELVPKNRISVEIGENEATAVDMFWSHVCGVINQAGYTVVEEVDRVAEERRRSRRPTPVITVTKAETPVKVASILEPHVTGTKAETPIKVVSIPETPATDSSKPEDLDERTKRLIHQVTKSALELNMLNRPGRVTFSYMVRTLCQKGVSDDEIIRLSHELGQILIAYLPSEAAKIVFNEFEEDLSLFQEQNGLESVTASSSYSSMSARTLAS